MWVYGRGQPKLQLLVSVLVSSELDNGRGTVAELLDGGDVPHHLLQRSVQPPPPAPQPPLCPREDTHGVVEALVAVPVSLQAGQVEGVEGADRDDGEVSRQQRHLVDCRA